MTPAAELSRAPLLRSSAAAAQGSAKLPPRWEPKGSQRTGAAPEGAPVAAGGFLEHAEVHGNIYGTSFAALDAVKTAGKICILDIDVQARAHHFAPRTPC